MSNAIRWRLVAVGMLVVGSLVLFMANKVTEKTESKSVREETRFHPLLKPIAAAIDTLLIRYHIENRWVRSWNVLTPDRRFIRLERRVYVPPRFISLDFNHDLNRELARFGARVIATERTKESTVSMHIAVNGMIVESIIFVLKRDLE